jgi:hypothetical protein
MKKFTQNKVSAIIVGLCIAVYYLAIPTLKENWIQDAKKEAEFNISQQSDTILNNIKESPPSIRNPGEATTKMSIATHPEDTLKYYHPPNSKTSTGEVFYIYIVDDGKNVWARALIRKNYEYPETILREASVVFNGKPQLKISDTWQAAKNHKESTLDIFLTPKMIATLRASKKSTDLQIKIQGKIKNYERYLTPIEIENIDLAISAYDELGGK